MIIPSKEFINKFKEIRGAFSVCEAIALYNIVSDVEPIGEYLELGSHRGKSSMVIAAAMNDNCFLSLVEPEFKDTEWLKEVANLINSVSNIKLSFKLMAAHSPKVIEEFESIAFCFVDSGVHDDMVMEEVKLLEHRMMPSGVIAFHDYLNQFTAVERAYNYLWATGKFEPIQIDWKRIFDYVRENNLEEGNNSWHESGSEEFPKFVGALRRK